MISYKPLWETMERQNVTTYALIHKHAFNPRAVHHLKHNQSITLYTMEKLCSILHCTPNDIVEFIQEEE